MIIFTGISHWIRVTSVAMLIGIAVPAGIFAQAMDDAPEPAPVEMFEEKPAIQKSIQAFGIQSFHLPVPAPLVSTSGSWQAQGPGPTQNGQVENISPNNEVVGAVHTVVAHPTNPDILWIGATNGGIWKTTNATSVNPNWTPLTDSFPGLSIGAMELDPTDATNNTLVAGNGRYSSFGSAGGPRVGLLRTTNGGTTWIQLGETDLDDRNISGVGPRGNTILVSANFRDSSTGSGMYRSTNTGASFNNITGLNGLGSCGFFDLVGDPGNSSRFYTAGTCGVFITNDTGANWTNITDAGIAAVLGGSTNNIELAVHNNTGGGTNSVYVALMNNGRLGGIFRSANQGGTWTAMDLPQTNDGGFIFGLQPREKPGGQGGTHFSILADQNDANTVYVGGDRQAPNVGPNGVPGPNGPMNDDTWPNSIGATDFTGRLFRGDASVAPTGAVPSPQWEHMTHSNAIAAIPGGGTASGSSPHADSREMVFDANGNIIEVDDGGINRRTSPTDNTGDWFSIIGDLQVTEFHDIAYDGVSDIILGGAQDTGTHEQNFTGSKTYTDIRTADGGDVAIDDSVSPSTRYWSTQNLGGFRRRTCDGTNLCGATTVVGLNPIMGSPNLTGQFVTPVELNVNTPSRLIIGANNGVYESMDQGDNINLISMARANRNAMVYGHSNNVDLIVIGQGSNVRFRTGPDPAALSLTSASFPGGTVVDIAVDPADEDNWYVIDTSSVFETTNAGASWTDITGNIADDGAGNFRTIEYIDQGNEDRIVVGSHAGVLFASVNNPDNWSRLGTGLPNASVWDMEFQGGATDVLLAGTLGRGAWTLENVSTENLAPVAVCMDVTVDTDLGICTASGVSVDDSSSDPDGDGTSLAQVPDNPYALGDTHVHLTVTDTGSLKDSCEAVVTVLDNEDPTITAPMDVVDECDSPGGSTDVELGTPITGDNCMVEDIFSDAPAFFPLGDTMVEWTVTDTSGNSAMDDQLVTVVDTTPPVVECNADEFLRPRDTPVSYTATAVDICDDQVTAMITNVDCFRVTPQGKIIDQGNACNVHVSVDGNTLNISNSGGVGNHIVWTVEATDMSGNMTVEECEVVIVNKLP